ncbi:TPA: hypothetical protein DCR49_05160 [Candidatus Delongbacteria bacterium]|nr:hypothetical protein [Candidatus Delongbacteria bacterium]
MRNFIILIITVLFLSIVSGQELKIQFGHSDGITAIAFSPDGKFLISGSHDKTVRLWDVSTGKEIRTFYGHTGQIHDVEFSSDGMNILSGASGNSMILWNVSSEIPLKSFTPKSSEKQPAVCSVAFSKEGRYVLSGSGDTGSMGELILWDLMSGEKVTNFIGHKVRVVAVDISEDGNNLLSSYWDGTFKLWNKSSTSSEFTFKGHTKYVSSVSFSRSKKYILSSSYDNTIKLWDFKKREIIKTFNGHKTKVFCAKFSPDGNLIATCGDDRFISIFNTNTGKQIKIIDGMDKEFRSLDFSSDGKRIAAASENKIKIWDINTGNRLTTLESFGDKSWITTVQVSNNGSYLLSGSNDRTIKLWDRNAAFLYKIFKFSPDRIISASISEDNKYVFSATRGTVQKWKVETCEKLLDINVANAKELKDPFINYRLSAFSRDGKYALTGAPKEGPRMWDMESGEQLERFMSGGHDDYTRAMKFSKDGKLAVSTANGGDIILWDVNKGKKIGKFHGHEKWVTSLAVSDDKKYVVSGSKDRTVRLWDIKNLKELKIFTGHLGDVEAVAISPDSKYILSATESYAKTVELKLWNVEQCTEEKSLIGHKGDILSVDFFPDGKYAVTGSKDGSMIYWDLKSDHYTSFISHPDQKGWLIFTDDGYWDSSLSGGELVAIIKGMDVFNIDQFAVKNNRPDIILQRLGSNNNGLITHYYQQYQKRLRRLGLTEDQLSTELHVPVSEITDSRLDDKYLTVNLSLSDSKYQLKRYNIYANDVPLFGSYGKEISGSTVSLSEKIELTSGTNKIEVSCMNDKGAESYRALTYAEYKGDEKGDLYYLAFGVSQYKDSSLNLKYADKDAKDLSDSFSKLDKQQYKNIFVRTFTNEQATVANIKSAKDFLKNSKPDDTFILFIAGHGVHDTDKEATYYYLTHETNLNDLTGSAANFELIEDILQGIHPRNKLFLMDTCESGEIEEGVQNTYYASADSRGLKGRGIKVVEKASIEPIKAEKRTYLYEKDRYIYNDLARRSGAIVFSSSKGGELSYEKDEIQNGLFTEEIIKCLASKEADKDKNGIISTDELRDYVSKAVAASSGGLQNPTVDRDNIFQKFGFGIVK